MNRHWLPHLSAAVLSLTLLLPTSALSLDRDQAAELLEQHYVYPLTNSVLEQPTISDMLAQLNDPYTQYFLPDEYESFQNSMRDSHIVGIGIVCTTTPEGLLLDQVYDGSPAQTGGLMPGDLITHADGTPLIGLSTDQAVSLIRGPEGTACVVTYQRQGEVFTAQLIRQQITVPATTYSLLDGHIGLIRCTTFGPETLGHFRDAILSCAAQGPISGWIVDLRGNTGGYTDAAVDSAALFTGPGIGALMRGQDNTYGGITSDEESITLHPVLVLVDHYSASASELFASCIRDRRAGLVVGSRTYGKGVAQTLFDKDHLPELFPDGDALKMTTHRFFSPHGNTTDQIGVIPDLLVPPAHAQEVARLLLSHRPEGPKEDILRIRLNWIWDLSLEDILVPEHREDLQLLLDALPPSAVLQLPVSNGSFWIDITADEFATQHGLTLNKAPFPDLGSTRFPHHVTLLNTYGLIKGYEDGTFRPQETMTRAELCQMLASALGCFVPDQPSTYADVPDDAWYKPAVTALTKLGLVNGIGNGCFDPDCTVDHQQFITIMGRMATWININFYNALPKAPKNLSDMIALLDYAPWAKKDVWLLSSSQEGLLGNTLNMLWAAPHQIDPRGQITREEAAYTLCTILNHTGILPQ